jgi:hypothetical protein
MLLHQVGKLFFAGLPVHLFRNEFALIMIRRLGTKITNGDKNI